MAQPRKIRVRPDGTIECVYAEDVAPLYKEGNVQVRRASHVEPDPEDNTLWLADLTPSGGPVLKGFASRDLALAAEAQWLEEHDLGRR